MAKKNKKIVRYRRPLNINVGMIIFAIIFVYMVFSVSTYMRKEKIQFYEVVEGTIVNSREYTGIILRQEETHLTEHSGSVSYLVQEGKRASVGTSVYSFDDTGSMAALMEENQIDNTSLTDANLTDIKKQLSQFSMSYENQNFGAMYDMQRSLEAQVLEYVNFNARDSLGAIMTASGLNLKLVKSDKAGVISYAIDGFEGMIPAEVSDVSFDRSSYSKAITKTGQRIEAGFPLYKLITSDDWSIVFPVTEDEVVELTGTERLTVKFASENLTVEGAFSVITGSDGKPYGKLDLKQYMVQFVSERYVSFEIVMDKVEGLKIPVTAVTEKNFYMVPVDYLTQGGNSSETGFLKGIYSENGESVEFYATELYYSNDEYYYIDMSEKSPFKDGDYVVKPNSKESFRLGQSATLKGVYNINKGYTVFKQIDILKSNDEYYTVRKGQKYGLTVYDHIVLKADTVYEGQLIYQ